MKVKWLENKSRAGNGVLGRDKWMSVGALLINWVFFHFQTMLKSLHFSPSFCTHRLGLPSRFLTLCPPASLGCRTGAVPPSERASGPPCKSQGSKSVHGCWQPCSEHPLVRAGNPVQHFYISNILSLNTRCPNAYVINKGLRDSTFWCNYIAPYHYFS